MTAPVAVAAPLQDVAIVAAAGAGAAALALAEPRRRAMAVLAAPVLAVLALATLLGAGTPALPPAPALAAAGAAGVAVVGALAWLVHRRPAALALLAVAALPFRVPVTIGDTTANLLLPLYAVVAAACLAYAVPRLRGEPPEPGPVAHDPRVRRVEHALAAVLALYGLQAIYSSDPEQALKNVAFFYVPFALLLRALLEIRWTPDLLRRSLHVTVGLAVLFAAIGVAEFATGHLLIANDKVVEANALQPYFRVNSLFFDPNIYGRYLALAMTLLAAVLLWTRRRREAWLIAAVLALLWAGLVFSLSQSSFAALLFGLAVLAALRWRPWPVAAACAAAGAVAIAFVLLAPHILNVETSSERALDRATSGRLDLMRGGFSMVADRPLLGFGSGAFGERYREREDVSSEEVAAASHTIPLTVAAEQGVLGLAAYLFLVWAAVTVLLAGLRRRLARGGPWPGAPAVARAGLSAAYAALLLHTLVYAAYLEDPLAWVLLAIAAGLRSAPRDGVTGGAPATEPPAALAAAT